MRAVILLLTGMLNCAVNASSFEVNDYARSAHIEPAKATLQRIDLKRDVLEHLASGEGLDVMVFDSDGRDVASRVVISKPGPVESTRALAFHRFDRSSGSGFAGVMAIEQQKIDPRNAEISRFYLQQPVQQEDYVSAYIIELDDEAYRDGLNGIRLDWRHEPGADLLRVRVEGASDPDRWRVLQEHKNLFKGKQPGAEWHTVSGIPSGLRYLRLTPHDGISEFELINVTAVQLDHPQAQPVWSESMIELVEDSGNVGFYRFELPAGLRPDYLRLRLPEGQHVTGYLYAGGDDFNKKWRLGEKVDQHNISALPSGKPVDIRLHTHRSTRHWWFQPDSPLATGIGVEPGYLPRELHFFNNGRGPFELAWGNHAQRSGDNGFDGLFKVSGLEISDAVTVSYSLPQTAGGEARLLPPRQSPWMTWVLWALLIAAVVVTLRMAYNLYRDMNPS